jgi:hypothetical protein
VPILCPLFLQQGHMVSISLRANCEHTIL